MKNDSAVSIGILTISDRCSRGQKKDESGPRLYDLAQKRGWNIEEMDTVPDDIDEIQDRLLAWSDRKTISLILTTGGTGLSPRDVTAQATREILDKEAPGLSEMMRSEGRKLNPFSVLSQGVVGVRRQTLIVNLPGSPDGAEEALGTITDMIAHALHIISGGNHETEELPHADCI